jgi:hypothetical protein
VAWFLERLTGVDPEKQGKRFESVPAGKINNSRVATICYLQRKARVEKKPIK